MLISLVLEQRLSFVGLYPLNGERERSKMEGRRRGGRRSGERQKEGEESEGRKEGRSKCKCNKCITLHVHVHAK